MWSFPVSQRRHCPAAHIVDHHSPHVSARPATRTGTLELMGSSRTCFRLSGSPHYDRITKNLVWRLLIYDSLPFARLLFSKWTSSWWFFNRYKGIYSTGCRCILIVKISTMWDCQWNPDDTVWNPWQREIGRPISVPSATTSSILTPILGFHWIQRWPCSRPKRLNHYSPIGQFKAKKPFFVNRITGLAWVADDTVLITCRHHVRHLTNRGFWMGQEKLVLRSLTRIFASEIKPTGACYDVNWIDNHPYRVAPDVFDSEYRPNCQSC